MNKRFYIQLHNKPVFWLMLLLIFTAGSLSGQMTVTIGEQHQCENAEVYVPVDVSDFNDVAAFTLFIQIDTLAVEYVSIENPNAQLSGGSAIANFVGAISQIIISWSSMSAANISDGKLLDLKMNYHEGVAGLNFQSQCEIVLSNLTIVENVIYQNGLLVPIIQFIGQPQSVSVTEGQQAQFNVSLESFTGVAFQWQQHDGLSWSDLTGIAPFTGVNTNQLTIDDVPLLLNNFAFRCSLQFEDCYKMSDSATLTVTPLTVISNKSKNESLLCLFPNPCYDKLNYSIKDSDKDFQIQIVNLMGEIVFDDHPPALAGSILMDNLNPGIYFFQVMNNNICRQTVKVLKH